MGKDETPALSLVFNPRVPRIPGEVLAGEVRLYFPTLLSDNIEEVHLKLRGSIVTKITRQQGQNQVTRRQCIDLARETVSLWQKGSSLYPPPDSHVLAIPFRFQLPTNLPPSCSFGGFNWSGTVGYALEVVGERSGLHFNRRVFASSTCKVLAYVRRYLRKDGKEAGKLWREGAKSVGVFGENIRKLRQQYLLLPDLEAFPMNTLIPFNLNVVTITKPMKMDDTKEGEPIFPAPPIHPKELEFELNRTVHVRAHSWTRSSSDSAIARLGGFGESALPEYYANVQVEHMDKAWIPSQDAHDEKKHKGQWKQEVTIKSALFLKQPPAFFTDTLSINYGAELKIEFPGIGNDLKFEFPIGIISCVPPPGTQAWDGPPPELDLPPSYFAEEEWHNDSEKGDE